MQMRIVKFTVTRDGFDTSCKMTIISVFKPISVSFIFLKSIFQCREIPNT